MSVIIRSGSHKSLQSVETRLGYVEDNSSVISYPKWDFEIIDNFSFRLVGNNVGKIESESLESIPGIPTYKTRTTFLEFFFMNYDWERSRRKIIMLGNEDWIIDITFPGIDMQNKVGGMLSGVPISYKKVYHLWGFLDKNYNWAGYGLTEKPTDVWLSFGGSGVKGGIIVLQFVQAPSIFTKGARVLVANYSGVGPQYEWNWGEIIDINRDIAMNTITVQLDNYANVGTNITGAVGGYIEQWNMFRPLKTVTYDTPLEYFYPHWSLMGEVFIDVSASQIFDVFKSSDEDRPLINQCLLFSQAGSQVAPVILSAGRYIPLWAKSSQVKISTNGNFQGSYTRIAANNTQSRPFIDSVMHGGPVAYDQFGLLYYGKNVTFKWFTDNQAQDPRAEIFSYRVPGGMLL